MSREEDPDPIETFRRLQQQAAAARRLEEQTAGWSGSLRATKPIALWPVGAGARDRVAASDGPQVLLGRLEISFANVAVGADVSRAALARGL